MHLLYCINVFDYVFRYVFVYIRIAKKKTKKKQFPTLLQNSYGIENNVLCMSFCCCCAIATTEDINIPQVTATAITCSNDQKPKTYRTRQTCIPHTHSHADIYKSVRIDSIADITEKKQTEFIEAFILLVGLIYTL